MTYILLMNKELCIKLVNEIILYYDVRSKKYQITFNAVTICR